MHRRLPRLWHAARCCASPQGGLHPGYTPPAHLHSSTWPHGLSAMWAAPSRHTPHSARALLLAPGMPGEERQASLTPAVVAAPMPLCCLRTVAGSAPAAGLVGTTTAGMRWPALAVDVAEPAHALAAASADGWAPRLPAGLPARVCGVGTGAGSPAGPGREADALLPVVPVGRPGFAALCWAALGRRPAEVLLSAGVPAAGLACVEDGLVPPAAEHAGAAPFTTELVPAATVGDWAPVGGPAAGLRKPGAP